MSAPLMDIALFTIALLANVVFTIVQFVTVSLLTVPSLVLSTHHCAPRPFNRPLAADHWSTR